MNVFRDTTNRIVISLKHWNEFEKNRTALPAFLVKCLTLLVVRHLFILRKIVSKKAKKKDYLLFIKKDDSSEA